MSVAPRVEVVQQENGHWRASDEVSRLRGYGVSADAALTDLAKKLDPVEVDRGNLVVIPRLTLRDQFAAAAMNGMLSDGFAASEEDVAELAYKQADAMMKRRDYE